MGVRCVSGPAIIHRMCEHARCTFFLSLAAQDDLPKLLDPDLFHQPLPRLLAFGFRALGRSSSASFSSQPPGLLSFARECSGEIDREKNDCSHAIDKKRHDHQQHRSHASVATTAVLLYMKHASSSGPYPRTPVLGYMEHEGCCGAVFRICAAVVVLYDTHYT